MDGLVRVSVVLCVLSLIGFVQPALADVQSPADAPGVAGISAPAVPPSAPSQSSNIQSARRPKFGVIWAGISVFGVFYLPTALAGAVEGDRCRSRGCSSPGWPLYIPVAGPFLKAVSVASEVERFGLIFTGLSQTAGLLMVLGGALARETVYFYTPRVAVTAAPMLAPGTTGIVVAGRF